MERLSVSNLEVGHGYTMGDLDRMARKAASLHQWSASDYQTRFDVAWSEIAEYLVVAGGWPSERHLLTAAAKAISDEWHASVPERHSPGRGRNTARFWFNPPSSFEEGLIERLALIPICLALPRDQLEALRAKAIHGSTAAAAASVGLGEHAFRYRLSEAQKAFREMWFAPDPAPRQGIIRHSSQYERDLAEVCGNGHAWDDTNTGYSRRKSGGAWVQLRYCRACHRARKARYAERKAAA